METTAQNETDNLETVQEQEPEITDNSSDEQENKPELNEDADNNENSDENESEEEQEEPNQDQLILGKFKSQDDLVKAFSELEKKQGEQSKELGELRKKAEVADTLQKQQQEIAELYGFKDVTELQKHQSEQKVNKEIANFVADTYAKHLNSVEFPEETKKLLLEYRENPTAELLDMIESEFPVNVIKQVAVENEKYKGQLDQLKFQAQQEQAMADAEVYLQDAITQYDDDRYFKNQEFVNIYTELFKSFGTNLDTKATIENLIEPYVQSRINAYEKAKAAKVENDKVTSTFDGLNQSDKVASQQLQGKSVLDMTPEELTVALRTKYKDI